jgi:uncharacterized repeat protein (TIGR02543 family)
MGYLALIPRRRKIMKISSANKRAKSLVSFGTAFALAAGTVLMGSSPALANNDEMKPIINLEGNQLATEATTFIVGQRIERFQLALEPNPLSTVRTTTRPGYSFGGWSYKEGEAPTRTLASSSFTTTRVFLYAVWNTKINLDGNGATKGESQTIDYRFAQDLVLPGAGSLMRKGYSFGGWMKTAAPGPIFTTYRAGALENGNPSLYAAWTRTVSFKAARGIGTTPSPMTYFAGGDRLVLPSASGLSRTGYEFSGWSTTPRGKVIKKSSAFLPKKANVTLYAVWKKN